MKLKFTTLVLLLIATVYTSYGQDTAIVQRLPQATVTGDKADVGDTAAYRYRQYKHYVNKVWPYVVEGSTLLREIDAKMRSDMSDRERRQYAKTIESEIKTKFEDRLRSLNKTEGKILVKLMNRQIGSPRTIYSVMKSLKGSMAAQRYKTMGKINGMDISEVYDPLMEPKLEGILQSLGVVGGEAQYFNQ